MARIYPSKYPSVPLVHRSLFTHLYHSYTPGLIGGFPAKAPAFIDASTGTSISREQLKNFALQFAHGLRTHPFFPDPANPTLRRGDTVMIFSPNSLAWPVVLHGSVAAGLRVSPANSSYMSNELHHQWVDSRAKVLFVHPALVVTAVDMLKSTGATEQDIARTVVVMGSEWLTGQKEDTVSVVGLLKVEQLLGKGTLEQEELFDRQEAHEETVYLCYSSGTTGNPKGVETTHFNITSVLEILSPGFPHVDTARDVILGFLPFYHIYGIIKLLHFPLSQGIPVVIMPRFDPVLFCAYIEKYKVTGSLIVPPVMVVLLRHPAVQQYDLRTLKWLISGAAPLGAGPVNAVRERLLSVGADTAILQGYGLTETSPTTHLLPVEDWSRKVGTIGLLLPNLEARIVDDDDVDVPEGESGELWMRGPTIMKGYLNNPSSTHASITPDGWFKSGDVATIDKDGFFQIVDRRKELIKYKGFQVPPAELEATLLQHEDIADAAVIGVYDEQEATELPRAYVVHANPPSVSTPSQRTKFKKDVQAWIEQRVARHKFLRGGVIVIDVVPKSAAGKILRKELRERAKKEMKQSNTSLASRTKAKL